MRPKSFQSLASMVAAGLIGVGGAAQAAPYDLTLTRTIPANSTYSATVEFTRDGTIIGGDSFQFVNGSNVAVTRTFTAVAPTGTNDRGYSGSIAPVAVAEAQNLPSGQVADFGDFLVSHGRLGASTFDSPIAIGSTGVSAFALLNDINAFLPVAQESNFTLGSTLTTNASGRVSGLPGLTFYSDSADTIPFSNSQLLVTGFISESAVPEPSSLALSGTAALCLLGYGWYYRRRAAA